MGEYPVEYKSNLVRGKLSNPLKALGVCTYAVPTPILSMLNSLSGSVWKDFFYQACGHEFKSRLK